MPLRPTTPSSSEPGGPPTTNARRPGDPTERSSIARSRLERTLAFLGYAGLSVAFFAGPDIVRPSSVYVGWGVDPSTFVWYLRWWPQAIGSGLNPLFTDLLWAPEGVSLAAGTPIPGPALAATPITLTAGPVVAYNVLALLAPALSAWTAYLLCRRLTGRTWPSVVGGYVFGFSTYEVGRMLGHVNLGLVFLLPLLVLVVLKRLDGTIRARTLVLCVAAIVAGQFVTSSEVLFTFTVFGSIALAVGVALISRPDRTTLLATTGWIGLGYVVAGVVVSPLLAAALGRAISESPIYDFYPTFYSTDLLNFVVPTSLTWLGGGSDTAFRFSGNFSEQGAYLGLPLLVIVAGFGIQRWRTRTAKFLLVILAVVAVATLGPKLHIAGRETVWMPWKLVSGLPLVKYALPGRFMLFAFLVVAVIVALWLSAPSRWPGLRWGLAALAVVSLLPNVPLGIWRTAVDTPSFFADGTYRRYIGRGQVVLVIPYGDRGNAMLWQAQTGMAFRMPSGYVTVVPPESFSAWPILDTFYNGRLVPDVDVQLKAFLGAHDVRAVVVRDGYPGPWESLFAALDPAPIRAGGVTVFRVPVEVLAAYRDARPPP